MVANSKSDQRPKSLEGPTVFALEAHVDSILETVPDAMIVIDERYFVAQAYYVQFRMRTSV